MKRFFFLPLAFSLSILAPLLLSGCNQPGAAASDAAALAEKSDTPTPELKPAPSSVKSEGASPAEIAAPAPKPAGNWVPVKRDTIYDLIPAVATFRAKQMTKLGSQVAGRVEAVMVDVGDKVKKGQELVRLERSFFEIEIDQRKAELEAAQASLADAKARLDRAKELWGDGKSAPISRQELDAAQTMYNVDEAKIHQAEKALRFAEERMKETVIRAPYDGVISQRLVHPGEPIQAMFVTSLLEIQEISTLEMAFALPQEAFQNAKLGMPVLFRVDGMEGYVGSGVLDTIFPAADENTRSVRCRVWVKNDDLRLRPGLLGEAGVVKREIKNALAVPRAALTQTSSGWRVKVLEEGKIVDRDVKIGLMSLLDNAEVKEGLKEGDLVLMPEKRS